MSRSVKQNLSALTDRLLKTGFFHIVGSGVLNKVIVFFSGIIVVRLLSKAEYGVYSYAYNILNIALLFNGIGAASAVLQLCSEQISNQKKAEVERIGLFIGPLFDVMLSVVILLYAVFSPEKLPGSSHLLAMASLFPIPQLIFDLQTVLMRARLQNREYSIANIINTAFVVAGTIFGAWCFRSEGLLAFRLVGTIASTFVVQALYHPLSLPKSLHLGFERNIVKSYIGIAIISTVSSGLASFTYLIGTLMVGQVLGDAEAIASYQAASSIPVALNFLPSALITYIYPYFAYHKDDAAWLKRYYGRLMLVSACVFSLLSLFCCVFAEPIICLAYGEGYISSVGAFRLLMMGFAISTPLRTISGNLLATQRMLKTTLISNLMTVLTIYFGCVYLLPPFGIGGAAVAQVLGLIVAGAISTTAFVGRIIQLSKGRQ